MKITLDRIPMLFRLILSGAWHDGRRNALSGNNPEKVSNMQKTNKRATNETSKELKGHAGMIICPTDPTGLLPTMYHHRLPTAIVTLLRLSNF